MNVADTLSQNNESGYKLADTNSVYSGFTKVAENAGNEAFPEGKTALGTPFYFNLDEMTTDAKKAYVELLYTKTEKNETTSTALVVYELDLSNITYYSPTIKSLDITYQSPVDAEKTETISEEKIKEGGALITLHPGETVTKVVATMSDKIDTVSSDAKVSLSVADAAEKVIGTNPDYATLTKDDTDATKVNIIPNGGAGTSGPEGTVTFSIAEGLIKTIYGETNKAQQIVTAVKKEEWKTPASFTITKSDNTTVTASTSGTTTMKVGDEVTSVTADFSSQPVALADATKNKVSVTVTASGNDAVTYDYGTIAVSDDGKTVTITPNGENGKCGVAADVKFTIPTGTFVTKKTAGVESDYQLKNSEITFSLKVTGADEPEPDTGKATGITLSQSEITIAEGLNEYVSATVKPTNTTETIEWTSSDTNVVRISENANNFGATIYGVAAGESTITAKIGELTATVKVTVTENTTKATYIYADESSITLSLEQYEKDGYETYVYLDPEDANPQNMKWTVGNTDIATVTPDPTDPTTARIYPIKVGATSITASCDGVKVNIIVRVVETEEEEYNSSYIYNVNTLVDDVTTTSGNDVLSKVIEDVAGTTTKIWVGGLKESYAYTGAAIKPTIHVYDGLNLLYEGAHYTLSYKNNTNVTTSSTKASKRPSITVKFTGNYKGTASKTVNFEIKKASFADIYTAEPLTVNTTGKKKLNPVPVVTSDATGKALAKKNYNVKYVAFNGVTSNNIEVKEAGVYTASITPKSTANMTDEPIEVSVRLVGTADKKLNLGNGKIEIANSAKKMTWTSTAITIDSAITVKDSDGKIIPRTTSGNNNYTISYKNNVNVGTATVVVTGDGENYFGTKTATFKIVKGKTISLNDIHLYDRELTEEGGTFNYIERYSYDYVKGGVKPLVSVYYQNDDGNYISLTQGKDYTFSYKKNTAPTSDATTAYVQVKGKGNYKFTYNRYFTINKIDLDNEYINVSGKVYANKKNNYKNPSFTPNTLTAKDVTITKYETMNSEGVYEEVAEDAVLPIGTWVRATFEPKSSSSPCTGSTTEIYQIIGKSQSLSKAKLAKSIATKSYTGNAIGLTTAELEGLLYYGSKTNKLVYSSDDEEEGDFEVAYYSSNVSAGTAKAVLVGTERVIPQYNEDDEITGYNYDHYYTGTKTITFKISKKTGTWNSKSALVNGEWQ